MTQFQTCPALSALKAACIVSAILAASAIASPAQTFKTLINFDGTDGAQPVYVSLAQGNDGNMYGTTLGGGLNGSGTVFKIAPWGKLTTIYSFCAQTNCADGSLPYAGLVRAPNGNFFGTTSQGGAFGDGTVFTITPLGALTILHSFNYSAGEGFQPFALLVRAQSGDFYGATTSTIFKITTAGVFTILNTLNGTMSALVQGNDGNFYGTAGQTVFQMTPAGTITTLHTFTGADGSYPNGLIRGTNGDLYGTTYGGGANNTCNNGCGTVFEITSKGALTTLYNFDSTHGSNPVATLAEGTDGNYYGTTYAGGTGGDWGTVFKMTPAGTVTTLHSFDGTDGGQPYGPVAQSINGTFYGTATNVGASNGGTLFSLSMGLGPFVETFPTSGKVGTTVVIVGDALGYDATGVIFGSTGSTFEAISADVLKAVVPVGAVTGRVKVTTPGTLTSNTVFRVIP